MLKTLIAGNLVGNRPKLAPDSVVVQSLDCRNDVRRKFDVCKIYCWPMLARLPRHCGSHFILKLPDVTGPAVAKQSDETSISNFLSGGKMLR